MLIMVPFFCSVIQEPNTIDGNTVPIRFKSTTVLKSSIFRSKIVLSGPMVAPGKLPPAPLIRMSIFLYFSNISFLFFSRISLLLTSVTKNIASPPSERTFSISRSPFSLLRAKTTTLAP